MDSAERLVWSVNPPVCSEFLIDGELAAEQAKMNWGLLLHMEMPSERRSAQSKYAELEWGPRQFMMGTLNTVPYHS